VDRHISISDRWGLRCVTQVRRSPEMCLSTISALRFADHPKCACPRSRPLANVEDAVAVEVAVRRIGKSPQRQKFRKIRRADFSIKREVAAPAFATVERAIRVVVFAAGDNHGGRSWATHVTAAVMHFRVDLMTDATNDARTIAGDCAV
jgi:hypothetical protein